MSARLTLSLLIAGLLVLPASASAATKNGITPLAPKAGKSVPAGKSPTFKVRANGPGTVWVHVCKSKKKDKNGVICHKASIGQAKKKAGIFRYKPQFFDFPAFWLNSPGTVLLAGAPDRLRGHHVGLPPGGADREVPRRGVDPGA